MRNAKLLGAILFSGMFAWYALPLSRAALAQSAGPQPMPVSNPIAEPKDIPYSGKIRLFVDATDVDRQSLERTRAAAYAADAFSEMPPALVREYFTPVLPRSPLPAIRQAVQIIKHDLTRERPPHPPYDLVVCRNVIIYFDRATQERLFSIFVDALAPGAILLLGKVETLLGPARERLKLEVPRERIYRKPA